MGSLNVRKIIVLCKPERITGWSSLEQRTLMNVPYNIILLLLILLLLLLLLVLLLLLLLHHIKVNA